MSTDDEGRLVHCVQMNRQGKASFVIMQNGLPEMTYYPDVPDASCHEEHQFMGPGINRDGLCWTIGLHESDSDSANQEYEIRVTMVDGVPSKVQWVQRI